MVDDNPREIAVPKGICPVIDVLFLPATKANETDNVVGSRPNRVIAQRDSGIRSRLSQYGRVLTNLKIRCQSNDTAHVEHHNLLGIPAYCRPKRARSGIVKIGDMDDFSATSARNIASVTFCTGESRSLRPCRLNKKSTEKAE